MAITDKDSVLILGAGVSAPFGLSLGGDMIADLSKAIKEEIEFIFAPRRGGESSPRDKLMYAKNSIQGFIKTPIHGILAKYKFDEEKDNFNDTNIKEELEKLKILQSLLDGQTSETIDDFIVENPTYSILCKIGISSIFMEGCYKYDKTKIILQPLSNRKYPPTSPNPERNWVHLLINIIRQGIRAGSVSSGNKVKIITFNYDKILEHILEKQFTNTEASYEHYTNYIDIIHVHGMCGNLDEILSKHPADICLEWARGIHVINEKHVPDVLKENRSTARNLIENARELYFCGFSFAGLNCRMLGLDAIRDNAPNRTIHFCNYDGNVGISKTVWQYESKGRIRADTKIEEASGTIDKPLSVSDWLKQGHLGELPG